LGQESIISAAERHTGVRGNQRDGSNRQNSSLKLCVKDDWVEQEPRTLDPEYRNSAGRAKKGNNGYKRPYIKSITRSRIVKISNSPDIKLIKSVNLVSYK